MDASTDPKFTHLVNTGHVVSFHERWQCVPGGSSGTEAPCEPCGHNST